MSTHNCVHVEAGCGVSGHCELIWVQIKWTDLDQDENAEQCNAV